MSYFIRQYRYLITFFVIVISALIFWQYFFPLHCAEAVRPALVLNSHITQEHWVSASNGIAHMLQEYYHWNYKELMYYCMWDDDNYRSYIDYLVKCRNPSTQALYADLNAVAQPDIQAIEIELTSKGKYSYYELCMEYEADKTIKWDKEI